MAHLKPTYSLRCVSWFSCGMASPAPGSGSAASRRGHPGDPGRGAAPAPLPRAAVGAASRGPDGEPTARPVGVGDVAIYHLNVRGVSLSRGSSAVKSAAYQSGETLTRALTGESCHYARSERVSFSTVVLPDGAPEELRDRATLWNAAEAADATRPGSHLVARRVEVAIPRELSRERAVSLVVAYARHATGEGRAVDVAIHGMGTQNPHAHVLETTLGLSGSYDPDSPSSAFSVPEKPKNVKTYLVRDQAGNERWMTAEQWRPVKSTWAKVYTYADGVRRTKSEAKTDGLNPTRDRASASPVSRVTKAGGGNALEEAKSELARRRAEWARMANEALAEQEREDHVEPGRYGRIDHRSNAVRDLDAEPTRHEGYAVSAIEARAKAEAERDGAEYVPVTNIRAENAETMARNAEYRARLAELEAERDALAVESARSAMAAERADPTAARPALTVGTPEREAEPSPAPVVAPIITYDEARKDVAALDSALDDARKAGEVSIVDAMDLREASTSPRAAAARMGHFGGDAVKGAADEANEATRAAEKDGHQTLSELLNAALARLRSYVARLLVIMELVRTERGPDADRMMVAREALRREREAPRPEEARPETDEQRQLELTYEMSHGGRRRERQL